MTKLLSAFMSPETADGKMMREMAFLALAVGAVASLEFIDGIDFGESDKLVNALIYIFISRLNRFIRPVKRETK